MNDSPFTQAFAYRPAVLSPRSSRAAAAAARSRASWPLRFAIVAGIAAATFVSRDGSATPTFPRTIARHLGSEQTVACTTCHEGPTRKGTVTTPVGAALRARGLVAHDEDSLVRALDTARADGQDSDGDGAVDVDELRSGENPNVAAASSSANDAGCSTTPQATGGTSGRWGMLVMLGLLVARAARRARPAPRESYERR